MAATRRATKIASALEAKGMERTESHHHMFRKQLDGVTTLVTRISHGVREVDDNIARAMGAQLYLQLAEFWRLIECPLGEAEWDALVTERCVDGRNPFLRL